MSERDVNSVPRTATSSEGYSAWTEAATCWLIHHSALRAPASLSERLEEEWLADLEARPSALSRLRFALGCCWATRVIAHEHRASSVPVTSSAMGEKAMIASLHNDSGFFARRSTTFLMVVCLHIALFYALMTGLEFKIFKVIPNTLQTRILQESRPRESLPPLPPPQWTNTKIEASPPEFRPPANYEESVDVVLRAPTNTPPAPQAPPSIPIHEVNRIQGGPGSGFPHPDDFYPSAAKRMEEQGIATVSVCVDASGRLTSDPTTLQTSGSSRLDEGALQLAKAGSGHYRATTEDGRAVNSCYSFRVRFELRN
jgi:TonB family protein